MTSKSVLCIRHGESTFNRAYRETGCDPLHIDAPLTDEGLRQAREAAVRLADVAIDLVVTTPLTRALQTTAVIFAEHPSRPPVLVEALHREHGGSSCDVGRSPALLASEFPSFGFDHLAEVWWHHDETPDDRGVCVEPLDGLRSRVAHFRTWLLDRPEKAIAVVGHHTFFLHLTGKPLINCEIFEFRL